MKQEDKQFKKGDVVLCDCFFGDITFLVVEQKDNGYVEMEYKPTGMLFVTHSATLEKTH